MEETHLVERVPLAKSRTYSPSFSQGLLDLSCTSMEAIQQQSSLEGREGTQHHPSLDISC